MTGHPVRAQDRLVATINSLNKRLKRIENIVNNPTEIGGVLNRASLSSLPSLINWSFENSTDSWVGSVATLSSSVAWATEGSYSLEIISTGGSNMGASSPELTVPVSSVTQINVQADVYAPQVLGQVTLTIAFYNSSSVLLDSYPTTGLAMAAQGETTLQLNALAVPNNTSYCIVSVNDNETTPAGYALYVDNVQVNAPGNIGLGWTLNNNGSGSVPTELLTGALAASLIGNIGVLNSNPYFAGGSGVGWTGTNGNFVVTATPPAGSPYGYAGAFSLTGSGGYMEESVQPFPITASTQYLVTAWVYSTDATAVLGFSWLNASGGVVSNSTQSFTVTPNTWTQVTTVQASPATTATQACAVMAPGTIGDTIYGEAILVLPQVPGQLIQAGTITAIQIAAGIIVAGIVNGTLIEGAQFLAYGTNGEILIYNGIPTTGNLICAISGASGSDSYSNSYPQGLYVNVGAIYGSAFNGNTLTLDPGPFLLYGDTTTVQQVISSGSGNWAVPASVTSPTGVANAVQSECWGGGSGGHAPSGSGGGGGGEYACEPNLAVTPSGTCAYVVGSGGADATNGNTTTFVGTSVTVTAHGGLGTAPPGNGGSGSTNTIANPGAGGGTATGNGGGGGGSSGGPLSGGNGGISVTGNAGGAGGPAVYGGGPGGHGGNYSSSEQGKSPSMGPGGGAGGSATGGGNTQVGATGQIKITYVTTASTNLLASLSAYAGTDPATGQAFPGPGFGLANSTAPESLADWAALFANEGILNYVSGADGNTYDTGHLSVFTTTGVGITVVNTSYQTISPGSGPSLSLPVGIGSYICHARLVYAEATAGTPRFQFIGPTFSQADLDASWSVNSSSSSWGGYQINALGPIAGPVMGSHYQVLDIWLRAIFTASGTLSLQANTSASADNYSIEAGAMMMLFPVVAT